MGGRDFLVQLKIMSSFSTSTGVKKMVCFLPNNIILNLEHKPKAKSLHCSRPIDMELSQFLGRDS